MAQIETSVQIAAPAEVVFAFFVPQRMPYWYGADMQASFEVQDGASDFAVAQKVQITGNLGRREVSHTAVVMALKNRMELTLGIAIGSSLQIALFVAPVLVIAQQVSAP